MFFNEEFFKNQEKKPDLLFVQKQSGSFQIKKLLHCLFLFFFFFVNGKRLLFIVTYRVL